MPACIDTGFVSFENFNLNKTIKVNRESDIRCISLEGIENPTISFSTIANPFLHGDVMINKHYEPRFISVTLQAPNSERQRMTSFFAVGTDGRFTGQLNSETRYIDYTISSLAFTQQRCLCSNILVDMTLRCSDPFFNGMDDFGEDLAEQVKLMATPFVDPIHEKYVISYSKHSRIFALTNDGDIPIGIRVRIFASDTVVNPKINLNNQFIRIIQTMESGDVIEFSTVRRNKYVTYRKKLAYPDEKGNNYEDFNILHKVDERSTSGFLELPVGKHNISWGADDGEQNMQINLFRRWQYFGL